MARGEGDAEEGEDVFLGRGDGVGGDELEGFDACVFCAVCAGRERDRCYLFDVDVIVIVSERCE